MSSKLRFRKSKLKTVIVEEKEIIHCFNVSYIYKFIKLSRRKVHKVTDLDNSSLVF